MLEDAFEKLDEIMKARIALSFLQQKISMDWPYFYNEQYDYHVFNEHAKYYSKQIDELYISEGYFVSKLFKDFPEIKDHIVPLVTALAKRANKRFNED